MTDVPAPLASALADRYRIERGLGAGGMATVYLAEDLRHKRRVALKVLRPELTHALGPERFLREIETTANLRHPHILPLYDSGQAGEFLFYVMPYAEGETLRDRLDREKQLPVAEAVQITREVADALGYAHSRGVIHRDIKPENVLLESGHAVVADFGIAKAVSAAGGETLTQTGLALGTPLYMSPEQAAGGQDLDGRSDLYALGCLLYEMLTGEPPFSGPTVESLVHQHLSATPRDVTQLRPRVPREIAGALDRLLAKNPADRYTTAVELIRAIEPGMPAAPRQDRPAGSRVRWVGGAVVLAVAVAVAVVLLGRAGGPGSGGTMVTTLRQVTFSPEVEEYPSLAPDGERLVFSRDVNGLRQLVLTSLADGREEPLTRGEFDHIQPAWTPDGQAILFVRAQRARTRLEPGDVFAVFSGGDIWRLALTARTEERLITDAYNPAVAADGRIAFDASFADTRRIWVADARGRNARQVTTDSSEAVTHVDPSWSPGGRLLAYQHIERTKFDIGVVDAVGGETRRVTDDPFLDVNPVWTADGTAIDFSSYRSGGLNVWRLPVGARGEPAGLPVQITTGAGQDVQLAASPAGGRLAFTVLRINADLWRLPVDPVTGRPRGNPEPVVVTTREDSRGSWSPDGRSIAFNSDRSGDMNIWIHDVAGHVDRQLTRGPGGDYQPRWSPDGTRVVFFSARSGNSDIWLADVATGQLTQLTTSPWLDINPSFSPDGQRIAFQSDRQGRMELWVMRADGAEQRALTTAGVGPSHFVPWAADGRTIYFRPAGPDGPAPMRVGVADGIVEPTTVEGGGHMSFNPSGTHIADVLGHQRIWISPLDGGAPYPVFSFDDPEVRIDYPVWSPDGRWILFDRWAPEGGDIWLAEWR